METVETTDWQGVRTVTLNRPQALNAFNQQMFDDLADAFLAAAEADEVKVVVLTGAGRAFSAGADLTEMGTSTAPPKHGLIGALTAIVDCPKPVLLAVNGLGVGIGATLCGLADFVLMAQSARLRCPFSSLGLTAEAGSTYTFPRLMGRQWASWMLLSAEWMSSEVCLQARLVQEVVADDELTATVRERAATLAALPLASLMQTKALMMQPLREQIMRSIEAENAALARLVGGEANKEALNAFREKREANFDGL